MPVSTPNTPGVQIVEVRLAPPVITGVGTSTAGFVGAAPKAARFQNVAHQITSADQFINNYVLADPAVAGDTDATRSTALSRAVLGFFANGGVECYVVNVDTSAAINIQNGLKLLEPIDDIAIIAAPGLANTNTYNLLITQATNLGDRVAILDPPSRVAGDDLTRLKPGGADRPPDSPYAAFYYPKILVGPQLSGDPAQEAVTPVGHIAGVWARVDAARGVHKAPANENILNSQGVEHRLTDADQNTLNVDGVNLLRVFPGGNTVIWGARTLLASTAADRTFRYLNVRRLVNYIEETLQDGLRFAVFEPNNLALRQQITRAARGFLDGVWRDGALFGATAADAYYVRFPETFNTDDDRANGRLVVEIGLRATYPAEFIIIRIGLITQSAATA